MDSDLPISQLLELGRDGPDVRITLFDLGPSQVRLAAKGDLTLITVTGPYSPTVAREIEKRARAARGHVGLEFRPGPTARQRFDASIVHLLKKIQARCDRRRKAFVLSNPPQALWDTLKLLGVERAFRATGTTPGGSLRAETGESSLLGATKPLTEALTADLAGVDRRILTLNQSLERTVSLEKGLDSAERCVKKLLPQEPPCVPGYSFAFFYRSSEKVGGDFFDFIPLGPDRLGISIGDVSGHGLDAALVMGITKKLIHVRAKDTPGAAPSSVLARVHEDLLGDLGQHTFVTAIYGTLEPERGLFRFARAGHEYPVHFQPGRDCQTLRSRGPALGLAAVGSRFGSLTDDSTVELAPGSCLLLCTDGLGACRGERDTIYSRERLLFDLAQSGPADSAQEVLDHLIRSVETFSRGVTQADDMTAIAVLRSPRKKLGERTAVTAARRR